MAKMFYTLKEAQSKLDRTEEEINQFAREGRLREFRDGPRAMYKAEQVDQLASEINVNYNDQYHAGVERSMQKSPNELFNDAVNEVKAAATPEHNEPPLHDPYKSEQSSPYWDVVEKAINKLEKNGDLKITTKPYYVVGYLVKQLENADKK